jgi:hypothetical protein
MGRISFTILNSDFFFLSSVCRCDRSLSPIPLLEIEMPGILPRFFLVSKIGKFYKTPRDAVLSVFSKPFNISILF